MEDEDNHLRRLYFLLSDNLKRERAPREKSVLLTFLKTQSASRYKLLRKSALNSVLIPSRILTSLLDKGFIQCIESVDAYAITAKGVWHYEQKTDLINQETLLSYINEKFFLPRLNGDLTDREKVILFMMISTRSFSEKSSVDLKKDEPVKDKWKQMLERSFDLLRDLDLIKKLRKKEFLDKKGNVHIVSSMFRHNNKMVQKTRCIYSYTRKQEYFLDLVEASNFRHDKLSYLFWKIFKGNISSETVQSIIEHCIETSRKESIFLFDMREHIFSMPKYDVVIRDGLMDSILSRAKWAKLS